MTASLVVAIMGPVVLRTGYLARGHVDPGLFADLCDGCYLWQMNQWVVGQSPSVGDFPVVLPGLPVDHYQVEVLPVDAQVFLPASYAGAHPLSVV